MSTNALRAHASKRERERGMQKKKMNKSDKKKCNGTTHFIINVNGLKPFAWERYATATQKTMQ